MDKISAMRERIRDWILKVIDLARNIHRDEVGKVLTGQLLRSATSVGANYEEATETLTGKDLVYKLSVVKKEAKESKYWLGLISSVYPELQTKCSILAGEADEFVRMFAKSISNKRSTLNSEF